MHKLLLLTLLASFVSCGDSHIVNDQESNLQTANAECSLYFESEDLCLESKWETMPTASTFGSMLLTFFDHRHPETIVNPKNDPFVVLWMSSMGHGSSPVTVEKIGEGKFRIKDVFFIMPGPWEIKYQLKDQSTVVDEVEQKITI